MTIVKQCPFCGQIHKVIFVQPVEDYDDEGNPVLGEKIPKVLVSCIEAKIHIPLEIWNKRYFENSELELENLKEKISKIKNIILEQNNIEEIVAKNDVVEQVVQNDEISKNNIDNSNKIGIVDADLIDREKHRFPNLALMKISNYHKLKGEVVELLTDYSKIDEYKKVFISKVFTEPPFPEEILKKSNVVYGGTGFFFDKAQPLEPEIEHTKPDYDLYRSWAENRIKMGDPKDQFTEYLNSSIGFTTRGCVRRCGFCVNKNYTKASLHSPIEEFVDDRFHYITLLDDNILAYPKMREIWDKLEKSGKKFKFKQGMDFRLLNEERMNLLINSKNYDKSFYVFAFDDVDDKELISEKLQLWRSLTNYKTRFYLLSGFDKTGKYDNEFWIRDLYGVFERIRILMENGCMPYLMRYERWKDSPYRGTYSNLNRWCNYPQFFKKMSYREINEACQRWAIKGNKIKEGVICSEMKHMIKLEEDVPDLAKKYFDLKWENDCKYPNIKG